MQHDDNTRPGMYDLDLVQHGERFGACEVTGAADGQSIELWNLLNGRGQVWTDARLCGLWIAWVLPDCRVKPLRANLPDLLIELERQSKDRAGSNRWDWPYRMAAPELKVTLVERAGDRTPGAIFPLIDEPDDKSGGVVPANADVLVDWIERWICASERADNVRKLSRSGAAERHLFVILPGFSSAPWDVSACLMWPEVALPTRPPLLPTAITHLWAMSGWDRGEVLHWAPVAGWSRHDKIDPTSG